MLPIFAFKLHIESPITTISGERCLLTSEDKWLRKENVVFHCTRTCLDRVRCRRKHDTRLDNGDRPAAGYPDNCADYQAKIVTRLFQAWETAGAKVSAGPHTPSHRQAHILQFVLG